MLHLLLGEALLHAVADELLGRRRDPAQNSLQAHQRAEQVRIETWLGRVHLIQGVDEAAVPREVSQPCQVLFIDHVEAACRADCEQNAQVKQVHLFELVDRVDVDARLNTWLVQSVVLIDEVAKLVPNQLCFGREVLYIATQYLGQAEVLVQSGARLALAFEDVAKAGAQAHFASAVEHDLRRCDV